jgi:hypothetical protein
MDDNKFRSNSNSVVSVVFRVSGEDHWWVCLELKWVNLSEQRERANKQVVLLLQLVKETVK